MGYWARDGAYVHDQDDINAMEAMNETQGQRYDRLNRAVINSGSPFTKEEEASREEAYARRVEERARWYEGNREYRRQEELRQEEQNRREAQKKAYEEAKRRFKRLSSVKKLWLNITGNGIEAYNPSNSVEVLDSLYKGRSR